MYSTGAITHCTMSCYFLTEQMDTQKALGMVMYHVVMYHLQNTIVSHCLQIRTTESNILLKSYRLTEQYATDAFAKVKAHRLRKGKVPSD